MQGSANTANQPEFGKTPRKMAQTVNKIYLPETDNSTNKKLVH